MKFLALRSMTTCKLSSVSWCAIERYRWTVIISIFCKIKHLSANVQVLFAYSEQILWIQKRITYIESRTSHCHAKLFIKTILSMMRWTRYGLAGVFVSQIQLELNTDKAIKQKIRLMPTISQHRLIEWWCVWWSLAYDGIIHKHARNLRRVVSVLRKIVFPSPSKNANHIDLQCSLTGMPTEEDVPTFSVHEALTIKWIVLVDCMQL